MARESWMAEVPEELQELINHAPLCYLGTASLDGVPDVAPLVTTVILDSGSIAMAVTTQGKSATNLADNPAAALVVHSEPPAKVDASLRSISQVRGAQIKGTATVHTSGEAHEVMRRKIAEVVGADGVSSFEATILLQVEEILPIVPRSRYKASAA
jgi:predicted pyridoxine 5'-phosphate oxidase superfamily flavin-nucleotide-binding protein